MRALYAQAIIVAYTSPSFPSIIKTNLRICSHFQDNLVLLGAGHYLHTQ